MITRSNWLSVDLDGMEQVLRRRGDFAWLLYELLQNAYDTAATKVDVTVDVVPGRPLVRISVVDDDPDGFRDLTHAYTLYAPSEKKANPTSRGRYNMGEKLVLAFCEAAEVQSTTGTVVFRPDGTRGRGKKLRDVGTEFFGILRLTRDEVDIMLEGTKLLLPPIPTTINGKLLDVRQPDHVFTHTLPTEIADADVNLRRSARQTAVRVYKTREGEVGRLYEMGIPVVETSDPWTVEIMQKVPLNMDRDNVTPAYLRELRVAVVNETYEDLAPAHAAATAVKEALGDKRIAVVAINKILTLAHGEKRATVDPRDPESVSTAVSHGHAVLRGGEYTAEQWENIRRAGTAPATSTLFPTPKPYSDNPNATPARFVPEDEWTPAMRGMAEYAADCGWKLLRRAIRVHFEKGRMTSSWAANYSPGELIFNYDRLGKQWFEDGLREGVNDLLIHEYGHQYGSDHLSHTYHEAVTMLGAKLADIALDDPGFFKGHGYKVTSRGR